MSRKVYDSPAAALDGLLQDGMLIHSGGFGLCGIPAALIEALRDSGAKNVVVKGGARFPGSDAVDVFYDGRDRFTKCMPINIGGRQGVPAGTLLPEVLEILTAQVIP